MTLGLTCLQYFTLLVEVSSGLSGMGLKMFAPIKFSMCVAIPLNLTINLQSNTWTKCCCLHLWRIKVH